MSDKTRDDAEVLCGSFVVLKVCLTITLVKRLSTAHVHPE